MTKKITTNKNKEPLFAKMFPIQKITVLQAQYFDNSAKSLGTKGQSAHALKIMAYHKGWNIDLRANQHDWWRVVQLIEPKTVLAWARKKHAAGEMTDAQLENYEMVAAQAIEMAADPTTRLSLMGHIASPPGKHYYVGQYVYFRIDTNGQAAAILFVDGDALSLKEFKPTRKRGRFVKPGTPVLACLHDPWDILGRQRQAQAKLDALVQGETDEVDMSEVDEAEPAI